MNHENQRVPEREDRPDLPSGRSIVLRMLPLALAIFVFGVIYGVLARPLVGTGPTMLSSAP